MTPRRIVEAIKWACIVAILAMLVYYAIACPVRAAVPCTPNPEANPAFVLATSAVAPSAQTITGVRVYYRVQGEDPTWRLMVELPCEWIEREVAPDVWESVRTCKLDPDRGIPPLRHLDPAPEIIIESVATYYNSAGESGHSNVVQYCFPPYCYPAEEVCPS